MAGNFRLGGVFPEGDEEHLGQPHSLSSLLVNTDRWTVAKMNLAKSTVYGNFQEMKQEYKLCMDTVPEVAAIDRRNTGKYGAISGH